MAEDTGQSRVIPATPRRREEALKQGQIAFSPDLSGSLLLLVGVGALYYLGPGIGRQFLEFLRGDLMTPRHATLGAGDAGELLQLCYSRFLLFLGMLLGILVVAGIAVSILQVGFHIAPERLEANFERLSPARNVERLFSVAALVKGFFAILKLVLLAGVAYLVLRSRVGAILSLGEGNVESAVATAWGVVIRLAFIVSCVFAALGLVDFVYQKVRFEQGLMMTLEEYKEEMKREEGDPEVRGRIRQIARERAIRQMLAEVPRATAVVTNPTHFAVALYFKRDETPVPVVIAKGSGGLAWRIKAIAQRHGVPVLERRELARALYGMVEVNQTIPLGLFYAVAEVIAFVEKLRRGA